jgi:hypothetical protein
VLRDKLTGFLEGGEPIPETIQQPATHHPTVHYQPELSKTGRVRMFPVQESR